jgi:Mn-dependent DtxR family transcriptional regulator
MANVAVSEKSKVVLDYLKSIGDENVTAADIAAALGMEKKSVDGVVTSGLIRNKNYAERIPAQIEVTDDEGNVKYQDVKFIKLTDAGKNYDHEAALAQDAAAKAAAAAE